MEPPDQAASSSSGQVVGKCRMTTSLCVLSCEPPREERQAAENARPERRSHHQLNDGPICHATLASQDEHARDFPPRGMSCC